VGLEKYLDEGMFARSYARWRMRDPMLADLDLAKLQLRDGGVVDPRIER
jgi:hypothetical protein